ncbi:MAG TPA: hypothetical protein VK943_19630 [Arenibaculum sp.]|nr:hypothetical protein [Arenibaculum sp.]
MISPLLQRARAVRERFSPEVTVPAGNAVHLEAAMSWLCRAQDAVKRGGATDHGVSQTYLVRGRTWAPSYPETTGYIIPTFLDYARTFADDDCRRRALLMADWECAVQHPSGGVLAGALGDSDAPTVFNTGQVLFGWAAAFEETGRPAYRDALTRAAEWLCDVQDDDGCWRRFSSPLTLTKVNTYNTRTAWGLLRAFDATGIDRFRRYALRNIEWALHRQRPNGWLEWNCLTDDSRPLTHTIAYAMRGFLEAGAHCGVERYLAAAMRIGDAMVAAQSRNGSVPGRFDENWRPAVPWICLTGVAQLSLNCGRLHQITGIGRYRDFMLRANRFLKSTQKLRGDPNERGGIQGSSPIDGGYHPWQYPNWAAKFFADALMIEAATDHTAGTGVPREASREASHAET